METTNFFKRLEGEVKMPRVDYHRLLEFENKCNEMSRDIENMRKSGSFFLTNNISMPFTSKYYQLETDDEAVEEMMRRFQEQIALLQSEIKDLKKKKWYEFWK